VARFAVKRLGDVPQIASASNEPEWYPLQHYFRFTAFGANVYVAKNDGDEVLTMHDESASRHEELYLVTAGEARFTIDGGEYDAPAVTVVAVPDPSVMRAATAKSAGTTIVALGASQRDAFRSSWQAKWFEGVPQL
jgi:hypothetical protein